MAQIGCKPVIKAFITIELSEDEAAALDAIAGYGEQAFLDCFYSYMGRHYLQPYEAGLRSLFKSVRTGDASVQKFLQRAKNARAIFQETK